MEFKKFEKESEIVKTLKETIEGSTIHSFPNIIRNKSYGLKIMWIICLLLSAGYCAYSVIQSVQNFLNYDVISTTRETYENPIDFPVVTICNVNFFSTKKSSDLMYKLYNDSLLSNFSDVSSKLSFYYNRYSYILNANYLNITIRNEFGHSLNSIMISCIFSYEDCNLTKDFVHYFDAMYGNCFKFNIDGSKKISSTGSMNGLQLELYSEPIDTNDNLFSMSNGFYIFINNEPSFQSYYFDGIMAPLGKLSSIILNKFSVSKQPIPYSNCIADLTTIDSYPSRSFKKTFVVNNNRYKRDDCFNMCFQLYVGEMCDCYDLVSGPFPSNLRPCLNATDQICDNNVWADFLKYNLIKSCDCPFECYKTYYTFSTSTAEFPTKSYADYLLSDPKLASRFSNITYDQFRSSIASVNIFYNELIGTVIAESIKTQSVDLMSNIGGILGLFLGMSFLSFIEFAEMLIQVLIITFKRKFKATKINISNVSKF